MADPSSNIGRFQATGEFDNTKFRQGVREALRDFRGLADFARRQGTINLTMRLSGATSAELRRQISAVTGPTGLRVPVTFDVTAGVASIRAALAGIPAINLSTVTGVQAAIALQITEMRSLITQLRALGASGGGRGTGGAGSGAAAASAGTRALLAELDKLNNQYKRGSLDATAYGRELQALQGRLRAAASGATAGSNEFRLLDGAITRVSTSLRGVNGAPITKLKQELTAARAQFDAAAASATTLAQRQAAAATYAAELARIKVGLNGVAASGRLTADQLQRVNSLLVTASREGARLSAIRSGGFGSGLGIILGHLGGVVPGVGALHASVTGLSPALAAAGLAAAAFAAGLAASFRTAAQFQQTMADINALTQPTVEGFAQLSAAATEIGKPLGVGANEAARAILELNRAGLSATDTIGGGLTGALTLAGAAGIGAAEAGKLAASAMTAFKLSAEDMPAIADVFANFSNSTFLGAEDLSQAIAAVGPVARTAGLDLGQFAGYMATLAQGGFKQMSDAGTSLKTMLLSLEAPTETGAGVLKRLSVSAYDAAGNFRPLADTLEDLRVRLKGMTEQQQNQTLKDIFGQDAVRAATILLGETNEKIAANIALQYKQGEAARVSSERLDTYQGSVAKMKASWEAFTIAIGSKFLPAATAVVQAITDLIEGGDRLANTMQDLLPYILPIVTAFVSLRGAAIAAAAAGLWSGLVTAITGAFASITAAAAASAATIAALNPFALLAIAASALVGTVIKLRGEMNALYDDLDQRAADGEADTQKRIAALKAEGTELADTKAKAIRAIQELRDAQQGEVTGTDFFTGEKTYAVDPERVRQAQERVNRLKLELAALNTEAARREGARGKAATAGGPMLSPEEVKKQAEAVRDLRGELESRALQLKLDGKEGLERDLEQIQQSFDKLRAKAREAFAGDKIGLDGQMGQIAQAQAREEAAARKEAAKDAAEKRKKEADEAAKDARKAAEDAAQYARDVQRAEIDAMQDGAAKKAASRRSEIQDVQREVAEKVAAYAKYPRLRAEVEAAGRQQVATLQRKWAQEDVQAAKDAAAKVAGAQKGARDAMIAAIADETERRQAERQAQMDDLVAGINERLTELAQYPARQAEVLAAGRMQIEALQQQWARDDAEEARERAGRIVRAFQDAQAAEATALQAVRAAEGAQFELNLARQLAAAEGNSVKIAQIEAQAIRDRAALAERVAREQAAAERTQLVNARDEQLRNDKLSSEERAAIWRKYNADLRALEGKTHADALDRLAQREAAEREAVEKLRLARIAEAERPVTNGEAELRNIDRLQSLARGSDELLGVERLRTEQLVKQAAGYQSLIDRADALGLTDEERQGYAEKLADANRDVVLSQRQQVEYQRQLLREAQEVADVYAQLAQDVRGERGFEAAQLDLARATDRVGDSYRKALPFLQAFRSQTLKPADFTGAKDALNALVGSLDQQRQKLEVLRGEYDQQRQALLALQGTIAGFGKELGNENLLKDAISFNQTTFDAARTALSKLLSGGKFTAAELAEATKAVQEGYNGLKGAVSDLSGKQASDIDKQIDQVRKSGEATLKGIDARIKAAEQAGLSTQELQNARALQVERTEQQVQALEARKTKLERDAASALSDRTSGISGLLTQVQTAGQQAQGSVDALGEEVKAQEEVVKTTAQVIRDALAGAFSSLPAVAAQSGADSAAAFLAAFEQGLRVTALPTVNVGGGRAPGLSTTGSTVNNVLHIEEVNVTADDPRAVLQVIRDECRRQGNQLAAIRWED